MTSKPSDLIKVTIITFHASGREREHEAPLAIKIGQHLIAITLQLFTSSKRSRKPARLYLQRIYSINLACFQPPFEKFTLLPSSVVSSAKEEKERFCD